jgi:carbamoyl-phosphate synthase large subunit
LSDLPTVLVTGAGGPAGVAVLRALVSVTRVVAADADPSAVGLRLAHGSGVVPLGSHPGFVPALRELALNTDARALVCTVAEEMVAVRRDRELLDEAGIATWLPTAEAVTTCLDKWCFAQRCLSAGIAAPPTALGTARGVPGPWVVKPRFGRGSRDVHVVDTPDELEWALRRVTEPLVQTRLDGVEFTVDALVDRDGALAGAVPRWRLETKAGISTKGQTFADDELVGQVGRLLAAVEIDGPANVQGFVGADGGIAFTEVNPRFSGGLPLSLAAGADFVGEYLRGLLGLPLRPQRLRGRSGVTMTRYFAEVFEG